MIGDNRTSANIIDTWEKFLKSYRQGQNFVYVDYLHKMPAKSSRTFFLDYNHLTEWVDEESDFLQKYVVYSTEEAREALKKTAFKMLKEFNENYALDAEKTFRAEFMNSPVTKNMTNITVDDAGTFIRTSGLVQEYDDKAHSEVKVVAWICQDGHLNQTRTNTEPKKCINPTCLSTIFWNDSKRNREEDYIRFRLQQRSDQTFEGKDPSEMEYEIFGKDNVARVVASLKFGDYVAVDGIAKTTLTRRTSRKGNIVGDRYIEACYFEALQESRLGLLDPAIVERMREVVRTTPPEKLVEKMVRSTCSALLIPENLRRIILLFLVGSDYKDLEGKRNRGEIQLLLVGDPGTGKSEISQFVKVVRDRVIYNSAGKSTSVGLVGGYERDREGIGRIKAGVFGLARNGVVILDEFAGRPDKDYQDLLEPLSDMQSVSIAKGMQYRNEVVNTAVLAIANPDTYSRYYDPDKNLFENTKIPSTVLQRFDAIVVMRDVANAEEDEKKARHFFSSQLRSDKKGESDIFSAVEMKALIQLRREANHSYVSESPEASEKIVTWYNSRRQFKITINKERGIMRANDPDNKMDIPSADMRRLGAVMRFSQAEARLRGLDEVTVECVEVAIQIVDLTLAEAGHHRTLDDGTKEYMKDEIAKYKETLFHRQAMAERKIVEDLIFNSSWKKCDPIGKGGCGGAGKIVYYGDPDDPGELCATCNGEGYILQEIYKDDLLGAMKIGSSFKHDKPVLPGPVFEMVWQESIKNGTLIAHGPNSWIYNKPRLMREKGKYSVAPSSDQYQKLRADIERKNPRRKEQFENLDRN